MPNKKTKLLKFNTLSHLPVKVKYLLDLGEFKECKPKLIEAMIRDMRKGFYHALDGFSKNPRKDLYDVFSLFGSDAAQRLALDIYEGKYFEDVPLKGWQYNVLMYKQLPYTDAVKCSFCMEKVNPDYEIISGRGKTGFTIMHRHCAREVELLNFMYGKEKLS